MADNPRIEELRRRVQKDPASIAFAQLAEEHRRAGQYEAAVEVARAGLQQHPAYLSARVTLGRALIELDRLDDAAAEFDYVVRAAPDNLTAARQLADIRQRRQTTSESHAAPSEITPAVDVTPAAEIKPPVPPVSASPPPAPGVPAPAPVMPSPPPLTAEVIHTAPRMPAAVLDVEGHSDAGLLRADSADHVIEELEAWLAVLVSERSGRPSSDAGRH